MNIAGFLKFSLIDYPGKVAAVIFTQGCNFRCPFCHNPELVVPEQFQSLLNEVEIFEFLNKRQGQLGGIVITGGEPTLQLDLLPFSLKLKGMGFAVKLDTNGSRPEILKDIINQKAVDYIAMDIKASWQKYTKVIGVEGFEGRVRQSMDLIKQSGIDHEFRTTVAQPLLDEQDIAEIAQETQSARRYKLQLFTSQHKKLLDEKMFSSQNFSQEEFEALQKKYQKD